MKRLESPSEETAKRVCTPHMEEEDRWKKHEGSSNGDRTEWVKTNCMAA